MEPDRMNRFFSNLNEWINSKKKVTESLLFDLSEKAAELLEKSDYQKLKKESFFLMETLELYRQFDLTPEQENIFALGEIHGTFRLANAMERRSDMNQNLENDLRECQERYVVFDAVRECPGIQHKKLAQICKMTVPALTHYMEKAEANGYFHSWRNGRNKYYHLSPKGTRVLEKLEEDRLAMEYSALMEQSATAMPITNQYEVLERPSDVLRNVHIIPRTGIVTRSSAKQPVPFSMAGKRTGYRRPYDMSSMNNTIKERDEYVTV